MTNRGWSMRRKFTAMLLLPLVSLAALCGYAAFLSLGNALTLLHVDTIGSHLADPLGRTLVALQRERRDAMVAAANPADTTNNLAVGRGATDTALAAFLKEAHSDQVRGAENDKVRRGVDDAEESLDTLASIRSGVDAGASTPDELLKSYTAITMSIAEALRLMTILPDEDAQDFGQALYRQVPAGDLLSQEDALISAAAASREHRISPTVYATLVQYIGAQRLLSAEAVDRLPPEQRTPFLRLAAPGGSLARVAELEDKIIAAGPRAKRLPFPIASWRDAYDSSDKVTSATALEDISLVFTLTGPPAHRALTQLVVAGLLGVASLIVSVVMSVRMVRSLVGDISRLNASSRNLTEDALRDVVGRLRRGETVEVQGTMTRPVFVNREMADLGAAFDALQRTAVELAQEDMRLHQGISQLFVNLARRSQVLINRQLSMLDMMERHEEDANTLDRLFELDQLATRMRRYAEGLLIVSGAPHGRFWRRAVPAVDVIRGGVAETEQYARVVVLPVPEVGIQGRAAADVIHLLAELIENAEVFSPSDSEVRVSVGKAASGLVVEIDDRGLGMPEVDLAAANDRLRSSLEVSVLDSTRLGLVTVGRLAQRHHIEVTLRRSPYGGLNAVVLIPEDLLEWKNTGSEGEPPGSAADGHRLEEAAPKQLGPPSRSVRPGPERPSRPTVPQQITADSVDSTDPTASPGAQASQDSGAFAGTLPQYAANQLPAPAAADPGVQVDWARSAPAGPDGTGMASGALSWGTADPYGAHDPLATHGTAWSATEHGIGPVARVDGAPGPQPGQASLEGVGPSQYGAPQQGAVIDGLPCRVPQASLAGHGHADGTDAGGDRLMDWGRSDYERRVGPGTHPWSSHPSSTQPGPARRVSPAPFAEEPPGQPTASAPPAERPDRVRSMMSDLQAGVARARMAQQADIDTRAGRPRGDALDSAAHAAFPAHTPNSDHRKRDGI